MNFQTYSSASPVTVPKSLQEQIDRINAVTSNYEIYRWTPTVILSSLDMSDIFQIQQDFGRHTELSIYDFAWLLLKSVPHQPEETVYVVSGIVELYHDIQTLKLLKFKRRKRVRSTILWQDVTDYIFEEAFPIESIGATPTTKMVDRSGTTATTDGPVVYGAKEKSSRRIELSKRFIDKNHHPNAIRDVGLARNMKSILTLDQMSDTVRVYSYTSKLQNSIIPRKDLHTFDTFMMSFDWSEKEMRLGAVLQDYTMSFWDYLDDFSFEKCFKTVKSVPHLQSRIWYIEFGYWVTSDKSHVLNEWTLASETCRPWPKRHSEQIVSVLELPRMRLASSALDKTIVLWDMTNITSIMTLLLGDVSAHTLVYCEDFDLLLTAGYEIRASVWRFDSPSDCTLASKLEGHVHTVTALEAIKGTPLGVTADDAGFIKTWDLRSFRCIQTLNVDKISVTKMLSIPEICCFCAIGFRIYWLEYEVPNNTNANGVNVRILADIADLDFECSKAEMTKQGKRILVANRGGSIRKSVYSTGDMIEEANLYKSEIVDLKYDDTTRLFVTASADRSVKLMAEDDIKHPIKTLEKVCESQVTYAASCFDLGLLATASEAECVRVWKLTTMELVGVLGQVIDVCAMRFAAPKTLLLTADFSGKVYGWNTDNFDTLTSPVFALELKGTDYVNCMAVDVLRVEPESHSTSFLTALHPDPRLLLNLYLGTEFGTVQQWSLGTALDSLRNSKERPQLSAYMKPIAVNALRFEKMVRIGEARKCLIPELLDLRCREMCWKAYKEAVVDVLFFVISEKVLVTISRDALFDCWSPSGESLCHSNLRENTPVYWNLPINTFQYRASLYEAGAEVLSYLQNNYQIPLPQFSKPRVSDSPDLVPVKSLIDLGSRPYHRDPPLKPLEQKIPSLRQMQAKKLVLASMGEDLSGKQVLFPQTKKEGFGRMETRSVDAKSTPQTPAGMKLTPLAQALSAKMDQRVSPVYKPPSHTSEKRIVDYIDQIDDAVDSVIPVYLQAKKSNIDKANRSFSVTKPRFRDSSSELSSSFKRKPIRRLKFMQELDFDLNRAKNDHTSVLHIGVDPVSHPDIKVKRQLLEHSPERMEEKVEFPVLGTPLNEGKISQQNSAAEVLKRYNSDKKTFSVAAKCLMRFYGKGGGSQSFLY